MADTDAKPMTDGDITPPPATTEFQPAAPLKDTGAAFEAEGGTLAGKYGQQAADKVRTLADTGKTKAGDALDQLSQLLNDAAGQVDEKLGAQYGGYARTAATSVQGFSDQLKTKNLDELLDDARDLVRKSPAVAIGAAAAVGFVIARLVQSGIDSNKA